MREKDDFSLLEAISFSAAPEYRRVSDLPQDAVEQILAVAPDAGARVEYLRTYLPETCEEVFQATLIAQPWGNQYVPQYCTSAEEVAALVATIREVAA